MYKDKVFTAVILAGGSGKRMKTNQAKQFLELHGRPMLYYSLKAFDESPVDTIVLVTSKDSLEFCRKEVVEKYNFSTKIIIVKGGEQRYHSSRSGVYESPIDSDYLLIHDSARPCITVDNITDCMEAIIKYGNCTMAVQVTDTICQSNEEQKITDIPNRNFLWSVQTPQCFIYQDIKKAHQLLQETESKISEQEKQSITDDVWVIRKFLNQDVFITAGSYNNIKVTNPIDITKAEQILSIGS